MMDLDRDQLRKTYQLSRMGFLALAVSLVPPAICAILLMVALLGRNGRIFGWLQQPWQHWVFTLSVWGSLVGTMLLWGRWENSSWQRRTGFLLLMCVTDLVLWFFEQGPGPGMGGEWFRAELGRALGWAEFALIAGLSGDYLVHLGLDQADDSARSTRSLAATGAVIWMLYFCEVTNWEAGWPLRRGVGGHNSWLLLLGSELIWTITLIQATALVIAAVRMTNRTLREMDREDQSHELLRFPSESAAGQLVGGKHHDDARFSGFELS